MAGETVLAEVDNAPQKWAVLSELRFAERAVEEVVEVATTVYRGLDELRDARGLGAQVQRAALHDRFDELMVRLRSMGVAAAPSPRLEAAEHALAQLLFESAPDPTTVIREFIRLAAGMGSQRSPSAVPVIFVVHSSVLLDLKVFEQLLAPRRGRVQVVVPPPTLSMLAHLARSSNTRLAERARLARERLQALRDTQQKDERAGLVRITLGGVGDLADGPRADLDGVFVSEVHDLARRNSGSAVLAATSGDAAVLGSLRGPDIFAAVFSQAEGFAAVAR
ncbi:hypothetical protein EK0264_15920 [Epidermidibacterium keratini]|uniref:Uncharacterized protein n=1 Tax=Epidermidibacterium keratini TaxID=1891644 RepID=A0A7L4YQX1_9ACTN|nr:PIN domain-containing protein [Epidermidibacterium keratini]QHC01631.1 hypothetical protein EK0264_15920 [Epidermidibacterium keratini]